MAKDSKKPTLSDLTKDEQILFLGAELVKLKDLLMVTLDQMNRLNSYRSILSDILEETGIITHKELDKLVFDFLNKFYKTYSKSIPKIGKFIVGKSEPYEYLIDSIEKFYNQDEFAKLIKKQNFVNVSYRNLSAGIVAIHSAWKI